MRLRELPLGEQPRKRLHDVGSAALSDAELVAILLRAGLPGTNVVELAQALLVKHKGLLDILRADNR